MSDPVALPIAPNAMPVAALGAVVLVLLTWAHAILPRVEDAVPRPSAFEAYAHEATAAGLGRCALYHARFGGQRAQLIKVMNGSVRNYVVVEIGKRDPRMPSLRSNWLKSAYGEGEHTWLGEYASADTALAKAASLCPPSSRCWPGEADCGPKAQTLTPAQAFFGR